MSRRKKVSVGEGKSGIIPPDPEDGKIKSELKSMRVLTPYMVASRFNLRLSAARDFLKQLEDRGLIQLVSGDHTLKIYRPKD